jgi:hypothetical protein
MKEKKKEKISKETVHVLLGKQSVERRGMEREAAGVACSDGIRSGAIPHRPHLLDPVKPEMARNMILPGLTPPTHHQNAGLTLEPSALSPSSILLPVMASS